MFRKHSWVVRNSLFIIACSNEYFFQKCLTPSKIVRFQRFFFLIFIYFSWEMYWWILFLSKYLHIRAICGERHQIPKFLIFSHTFVVYARTENLRLKIKLPLNSPWKIDANKKKIIKIGQFLRKLRIFEKKMLSATLGPPWKKRKKTFFSKSAPNFF